MNPVKRHLIVSSIKDDDGINGIGDEVESEAASRVNVSQPPPNESSISFYKFTETGSAKSREDSRNSVMSDGSGSIDKIKE